MDHAVLFGRRLRSLRAAKNLKQRQLAEQKANMSAKYGVNSKPVGTTFIRRPPLHFQGFSTCPCIPLPF